jgi:carbon monoxide dehydrogenase subunit G
MEVSGEERINAPRERVWAALNNPEILRRCIPGCESMESRSPTEFTATVKVKVALISASFKGDILLTNVDAPNSYTLSAEGSGGVAGFAKAGADIMLKDDGEQTVIVYTTTAKIGGKLAIVGSRQLNSSYQKLAAKFFKKLARQIEKGVA